MWVIQSRTTCASAEAPISHLLHDGSWLISAPLYLVHRVVDQRLGWTTGQWLCGFLRRDAYGQGHWPVRQKVHLSRRGVACVSPFSWKPWILLSQPARQHKRRRPGVAILRGHTPIHSRPCGGCHESTSTNGGKNGEWSYRPPCWTSRCTYSVSVLGGFSAHTTRRRDKSFLLPTNPTRLAASLEY